MLALGRALRSFVYPPHCLLCDRYIEPTDLVTAAEGMICPPCVRELTGSTDVRCQRCSMPVGSAKGQVSWPAAESIANICVAHDADGRSGGPAGCCTCNAWPHDRSFERALCLGAFAGPLRTAILCLKFKGNRKFGVLLGRWLASVHVLAVPQVTAIAAADVGLAGDADAHDGSGPSSAFAALMPVPLHTCRRRERGYNQAELIARGVAVSTGTTLINAALSRNRATAQQARMASVEERAANLDDAFSLRPGSLDAIVPGSHIGLVDDVLTTGATLNACGRQILQHRPDLRLTAMVAAIAVRTSGKG